jgi:putative addiction module antidote
MDHGSARRRQPRRLRPPNTLREIPLNFAAGIITIVITVVELKVRKFGNSLGVILPKEVLQRLNAAEGDRLLLIETPDRTYQLTPWDREFEEQMRVASSIMNRYRNTLRILSK